MSFDEVDTTEDHEKRITRCKSCREMIIFLPTATGKQMPCDSDSVQAEDDTYEHGRHVSHFSTCTKSDQFRKPR